MSSHVSVTHQHIRSVVPASSKDITTTRGTGATETHQQNTEQDGQTLQDTATATATPPAAAVPSRTSAQQHAFALIDLIAYMLSFLPAHDIIRTRHVSHACCQATHRAATWSHARLILTAHHARFPLVTIVLSLHDTPLRHLAIHRSYIEAAPLTANPPHDATHDTSPAPHHREPVAIDSTLSNMLHTITRISHTLHTLIITLSPSNDSASFIYGAPSSPQCTTLRDAWTTLMQTATQAHLLDIADTTLLQHTHQTWPTPMLDTADEKESDMALHAVQATELHTLALRRVRSISRTLQDLISSPHACSALRTLILDRIDSALPSTTFTTDLSRHLASFPALTALHLSRTVALVHLEKMGPSMPPVHHGMLDLPKHIDTISCNLDPYFFTPTSPVLDCLRSITHLHSIIPFIPSCPTAVWDDMSRVLSCMHHLRHLSVVFLYVVTPPLPVPVALPFPSDALQTLDIQIEVYSRFKDVDTTEDEEDAKHTREMEHRLPPQCATVLGWAPAIPHILRIQLMLRDEVRVRQPFPSASQWQALQARLSLVVVTLAENIYIDIDADKRAFFIDALHHIYTARTTDTHTDGDTSTSTAT